MRKARYEVDRYIPVKLITMVVETRGRRDGIELLVQVMLQQNNYRFWLPTYPIGLSCATSEQFSPRGIENTVVLLHAVLMFVVSRSQPNRMKIVVPSVYGLISLAPVKPDLSISPNHTWKSHGNRVACGHMSEQNCSSMFCYGL